jgi:signal transduction histidine kinase
VSGRVNKLLQSQIRRHFGENPTFSEELKNFLQLVDETYAHYEKEITIVNQRKREFLANMSHELRTPLNAILGYSEMLADEVNETGDLNAMKDDIQKIYQAGKKLFSMIEEILVLTRIESGKLDLSVAKFLIKTFLEEIAIAALPWIETKNNSFDIVVAEGVDTIETDEEKLRQILLNLLNNAGKFTNQGKVILSATQKKDKEIEWIVFQVTDTGRGILPENQKNLFEYFTHIDDQSPHLEGGAGIGLATSKRLIQVLGGEISVESAAGKGSTFTVLLPKEFHKVGT